ncbi:MAG: 2-oxoacid:acceptor oxidoreductase family protein [Chloroflexi bacterium]|nr:2-oxoacid:acceptor oxidoreductase family protein [Chloroflexota bacterium]
MKYYNIHICGVGGTGVMGLGMLLKEAAVPQGFGVVGAESRGVSQRGGAVTSSVRYSIPETGETLDERRVLYSGEVPYGSADLMIATESTEALRNLQFISKESRVVLNAFTLPTRGVDPVPVEKTIDVLKGITNRLYIIDASGISLKLYGSYRMANPILLGFCLAHTDIPLKRESMEAFLRSAEREALVIGLRDGKA